MIEYNVASGNYPFDEVIGIVAVPSYEEKDIEAARALAVAVSQYGHGVVVYPINED